MYCLCYFLFLLFKLEFYFIFTDKLNDSALDILDKKINLCLCNERIQVIISDEGQITCKAEDCVDGNIIECNRLAYHLDEFGSMPMLRANVALPFLTFCEHHMSRFFLHQSCPRCGRFCSEVRYTCVINYC